DLRDLLHRVAEARPGILRTVGWRVAGWIHLLHAPHGVERIAPDRLQQRVGDFRVLRLESRGRHAAGHVVAHPEAAEVADGQRWRLTLERTWQLLRDGDRTEGARALVFTGVQVAVHPPVACALHA